MTSRARPRRVALVAYRGCDALDVCGPAEVFATASALAHARGSRSAAYSVEVLAEPAGPVRTSSGLTLHADRSWRGARGPWDTVLVVGGDREGVEAAGRDDSLLRWLRAAPARVGRLGSICNGALVLARAGLLDGRTATTHWAAVRLLEEQFPAVRVEPDAIFVRDGALITSAGVTAGIDLALALVEEDLGRELALATARQLVVFLKRPGGQSQFSAELEAQVRGTGPLASLPEWIRTHLSEGLGVDALARRVGMSPRNFARVFREQFDTTPARFVERARVERARRRLDEGAASLDDVARSCGFGSAERMRRAFARQLGVCPADYRRSFATRPPGRPRRTS